MNLDLPAFPASLMGVRIRPGCLFTDPFSSPIPAWGEVPEADSGAVLMSPLRQRRSCFLDDGSRSEIREEDLPDIRRKYAIPPLVMMRSLSGFERAPDGGMNEVAVFEAYLEAGFPGGFPSLIAEFASLANKAGFYHLRSIDGAPLVKEPSRGIRGNNPFGDGWNNRYIFVKIQEPFGYPTFWRTVDVSRPVSFIGEAVAKVVMGIPNDSGNVVRLSVSAIYDEYQKAKMRKMRPFIPLRRDWLGLLRRLLVFLPLRQLVRDMVAHRELSIWQARASARWELMMEWLEKRVEHWNSEEEYRRYLFLSGGIGQQHGGSTQAATLKSIVGPFLRDPQARTSLQNLGVSLGPGGRFRNPEVALRSFGNPEGSSLDPEIAFRTRRSYGNLDVLLRTYLDPGVMWEPIETILRLPRQDYYWYLFGSRILPLGSSPLSSSYGACCFCRKPLSDLGGAGVDLPSVVTQAPDFTAFHVWISICLRRPIPALCLIPICFSVDVPLFDKGWPGSEVSRDLIQLGPSHPGASFLAALSLVLSQNSTPLLEGHGSDFLVVVLGDILLVGPVS
ncbi:hypothetical protein DY000_02014990 [Brassica cretica]|uniref:Uncharacterized protein n=1 Tax=Brassica cretica TaxID=69181 RepID=A0ABQ7CQ35_BRACR|nr:hypothetical protein DY000_02014990 [Brassica cretica]